MASNKTCSGSQSINSWLLAGGSCVYQVQLLIDGVAITTPQALNNTMSAGQIATIFNANRTGNTTGTILVQIVGNNLVVTITGIILSSGATGDFQITAGGTGFPCPNFSFTPSTLTCTINPPSGGSGGASNGGGKKYVPPPTVCFRREYDLQGNLKPCKPERIHYGLTYSLISSDLKQCCYKRTEPKQIQQQSPKQ